MVETIITHIHPDLSLHMFGYGPQLDHATIVHNNDGTVEYFEDTIAAKIRFNKLTGEEVY